MSLFEKRVLLFRKRDKETWGSLKRVLNDAGISFRGSHYEMENIPVGGYSAMDPRNFGKGGRIDREIYTISVKASLEEAAREAIRKSGHVAEVEDVKSLTEDPSKRVKRDSDSF